MKGSEKFTKTIKSYLESRGSKDRKQILEIIHANLDQIKKIKKRKVKQAVAA